MASKLDAKGPGRSQTGSGFHRRWVRNLNVCDSVAPTAQPTRLHPRSVAS